MGGRGLGGVHFDHAPVKDGRDDYPPRCRSLSASFVLERKTLDSTFGVARVCYTKKKSLGNSPKMALAGAGRPVVMPLPEVDAATRGWTKRNNQWLLRAAAATKSTGRYRHNAAMLYLGRIRLYEMGPLDRDRFTADRTATISVLGQPEKVASIHTQGRGDSKRIVARLESCGVDMQIRFYADAVSGSASYSVMGGAKYPISCVRMILFNQRVRSSLFFV